jgi:hypothetical protein
MSSACPISYRVIPSSKAVCNTLSTTFIKNVRTSTASLHKQALPEHSFSSRFLQTAVLTKLTSHSYPYMNKVPACRNLQSLLLTKFKTLYVFTFQPHRKSPVLLKVRIV